MRSLELAPCEGAVLELGEKASIGSRKHLEPAAPACVPASSVPAVDEETHGGGQQPKGTVTLCTNEIQCTTGPRVKRIRTQRKADTKEDNQSISSCTQESDSSSSFTVDRKDEERGDRKD